MIPGSGFIPQIINTSALMLNNFLPMAFEGTYVDSTKGGKPHDIVGVVAGYDELKLVVDAPHRLFTVILRQRGAHGLALVDRIE